MTLPEDQPRPPARCHNCWRPYDPATHVTTCPHEPREEFIEHAKALIRTMLEPDPLTRDQRIEIQSFAGRMGQTRSPVALTKRWINAAGDIRDPITFTVPEHLLDQVRYEETALTSSYVDPDESLHNSVQCPECGQPFEAYFEEPGETTTVGCPGCMEEFEVTHEEGK